MLRRIFQLLWRLLISGDAETGRPIVAQAVDPLPADRLRQPGDEGELRPSQHLQPFGGKIGKESGQFQARPVQIARRDDPIEPLPPGQNLQIKLPHQFPDGNLFSHSISPPLSLIKVKGRPASRPPPFYNTATSVSLSKTWHLFISRANWT